MPSGSSITCLSRRSGVSKVECTFHSGQVPPNFENGKVPEEKSLGDIAGVVDAQQEERHAARVRPLQRGQAVTDLLEAGIEALRQHMDVVAQRFRGGMERLVGHHHAGREIIRQRDAVEPARRVVERSGAADDGFEACRRIRPGPIWNAS